MAKMQFEFGRDNSSTTNHDLTAKHHCSSIGLTFCKPHYTDKYPNDYNLHEKYAKFDACTKV